MKREIWKEEEDEDERAMSEEREAESIFDDI